MLIQVEEVESMVNGLEEEELRFEEFDAYYWLNLFLLIYREEL